MTIQLVTRKGINKSFLRIAIDIQSNRNPRRTIVMVPITDSMKQNIIDEVGEANYISMRDSYNEAIEVTDVQSNIYTGLNLRIL